MSGSGSIRPAAVAGTFYPGSAERLADMLDRLLEDARRSRTGSSGASRLCGLVVPHAGYEYSGPVAATAFALLADRPQPRRVVILCPSHHWPLQGCAVPSHAAWSTPLGLVTLDEAARETAVSAGAALRDEPHRSEHSAEVQLPFLQRVLPDIPVLPMAVGSGAPEAAATIVAAVVDAATLLLVSSDLSHDHDAATARRLDARTARVIEAGDIAGLGWDDACGADGLRAAMAWAHGAGCRFDLLDLRDSSMTTGGPHRVVGYGAFAIQQA